MVSRQPIRISLATRFPHGIPQNDLSDLVSYIEEIGAQKQEYHDYALLSVSEDQQSMVIAPVEWWKNATTPGEEGEHWDLPWSLTLIHKDLHVEHPGMVLTSMNPTTREIRWAALDTRMLTVRNLVAKTLKRKPWDVEILHAPDGGWILRCLDWIGTQPYVPLLYDHSLHQLAQQPPVGAPGWFIKTYPEHGLIMIHPSHLPTFPPRIPMPHRIWEHPSFRHLCFGEKLPAAGRKHGEDAYIDLKESPGILIAGASNGGKTTLITSIIAGFLAAGGRLVFCDQKGKSADYQRWRPWLEPNTWGCDGLSSTAAVLRQYSQPGGIIDQRMTMIMHEGKTNWWELPEEKQKEYPLTLLIADEVAQYASPIHCPAGDKNSPDMIQLHHEQALHLSCYRSLLTISQTARSAGICFLYAAQTATAQNGLDPSIRTNLTAKILVGEDANPHHEFTTPCPRVPLNVIESGVGKGTGVYEISGQSNSVYKAYYDDDPHTGRGWADLLADRLAHYRTPEGTTTSGTISEETIQRLLP